LLLYLVTKYSIPSKKIPVLAKDFSVGLGFNEIFRTLEKSIELHSLNTSDFFRATQGISEESMPPLTPLTLQETQAYS